MDSDDFYVPDEPIEAVMAAYLSGTEVRAVRPKITLMRSAVGFSIQAANSRADSTRSTVQSATTFRTRLVAP